MFAHLLAPLLVMAAPRAACPAQVDALEQRLDEAYQAYTAFELEDFTLRVDEARELVSCLAGVPTPRVALHLHLVLGLAAWLDQDPRSMAAAVRGVYALEPDFVPGDEIAPHGSRILAVFDTARGSGPGSVWAMEVPGLLVDGSPAPGGVPTERAALLQWVEPGGELRSEHLAGLGISEALLDDLRLSTPQQAEPRRPSRWLLVGSGAAVLVGAGALWGAHDVEQRYWASHDPSREASLYRLNRGLAVGGYGLLGVGGMGAVGALVLWEF